MTRSNLSRYYIRHCDNGGRNESDFRLTPDWRASYGVSIVRILEKIDLVITAAHWISVLFFAYRLHISPVTASTKCLYWELEMLQHQGVDMWVSKVEETGNTVEVKMSLECERLFHQCVAWWDQRSTETILRHYCLFKSNLGFEPYLFTVRDQNIAQW